MMDRQTRRAEKAEARKERKRANKVDWFVVALCAIAVIALAVVGGGKQWGKGVNPPDSSRSSGLIEEKNLRAESP